MKQSTNYNMNKPDPNDMFSLEHWNQNTDKIDETLAPTFEDYTGETPVPTTDEALKNIKSKTKLSILMQNIKAFCKGCCTLGMLVDNCVTNNNNLPLAASQGKILMDQITSLNNNFQLTDNAARFVAGSSEKSKAYLRTFDVSGRLFQLALSESGLLFSGYNGDYGSSGKTLWEGVTKSDLDNKIQCGLSSIGEISPGESTSEITFPHSFPTAPKSVVGNIRYVGYGDSLSMQITGITTTGFSVYIHNTSSRKISIAIYWIACLN